MASSEDLQKLIDLAPDLIFRYDKEHRHMLVNKRLMEATGLSRAQFIGKTNRELGMPEDHCDIIENATLEAFQTGKPQEIEFSYVGPSGLRHYQMRLVPEFSKEGVLKSAVGITRDITKRKKIESQLKAAFRDKDSLAQNLKAIFRSLPDGILIVDNEMRVLRSNNSFEKICGCNPMKLRNRYFPDLFPGASPPCQQILHQTIRTQREVKDFQASCNFCDQRRRVLIFNSALLSDLNNGSAGAILIVKDITRLNELERNLSDRQNLRHIIGKNEKIQRCFELIEKLADIDSTVLITGESGTGKELVADALHYTGSRSSGPFVKVNCSALSESILESELFGHVKGAFTGALQDKIGRIQAAENGTIFLDEIGDISSNIQLKLLRVIEQREYEKVGDARTLQANIRFVAATNVNLEKKVKQGSFREDLYYRLNVMVIHLPPLRDRTEDIPLLVEHFIAIFNRALKRNVVGVSSEAMSVLLRYPWPGNIRELRHAIEHACILCPSGEIEPRFLPEALLDSATRKGVSSRSSFFREPKVGQEALLKAIQKAGGNKSKAARHLGISRITLYRYLNRHGLSNC